MRNWKELGEVPDSDDEDFESQETQQEPNIDLDTDLRAEQQQQPASEDAQEQTTIDTADLLPPYVSPRSPSSSPLSPPPLDDGEDDGMDELRLLTPSPNRVQASTARHNEPDADKKSRFSFEEDEISVPYVTITAPLPGLSTSSLEVLIERRPSSTLSSSKPEQSYTILPSDLEVGRQSPEFDSTQTLARAGRSLRPRKPIQQHPYLLESVQYAHVMKSHGVKPIRVAAEVKEAPRHMEGDSQDPEFEEEISQGLSNGYRVDVTDESQPILFDDMENSQNVPDLATSPLRASSVRPLQQSSSQRSDEDRTDNTSVFDDEFPDIAELVRRPSKPVAKTLKRRLSPNKLPRTKRVSLLTTSPTERSSPPVFRNEDIWSLPSSSPEEEEFNGPSSILGITPRSQPRPRTDTSVIPRNVSPSREYAIPVVDLTNRDVNDDLSGSETDSTTGSSKSGSEEIVRRNQKRIRGVLPASWLRLDQQKGGDANKKTRSRQISPEPAVTKRGVAIPRVSSPRPSNMPLFFSDDDSDDNDVTTGRSEVHGTRRSPPRDRSPIEIWADHDDAGSVVEEDTIDRMLIGRKRTGSTLAKSVTKRRKPVNKNMFHGEPAHKTHQPKITQAFERSSGRTSKADRTSSVAGHRSRTYKKSSRMPPSATRGSTPPLLSILDVLEPMAPPFLKIAARTAKRRQSLGKASPSHKNINLGTRKDNVDALSVLRDWKAGRIRATFPNPPNRKPTGRRPLKPVSANQISPPSLSHGAGHGQWHDSAHVDTSPDVNGENQVENRQTPQHSHKKVPPMARTQSFSARPAQLETEDNGCSSRGFVARKRLLDALHRKSRKDPSASSVCLDELWDPAPPSPPSPAGHEHSTLRPADNVVAPNVVRRVKVKSRFRKRFVPKAVDVHAPHIVHANDPLPMEHMIIQERDEPRHLDKLGGLGPYGTKYTHHFEIFPLDRGVYFHSSTIVGSGWIGKITGPSYTEHTRQSRARAYFSMDDKALSWGAWDDTVSSEFGILVDWIADQLVSRDPVEEPHHNQKPGEAAAFLLRYVVDSLTFRDEDSAKSFLSRSLEVLQGFVNRIDELSEIKFPSSNRLKDMIEVLGHFTLVICAVRQISRINVSLKFQTEVILTKAAKSSIRVLLALGLEDLRTLYGDLQHLSARERGIRSENIIADSWVVLVRVLEHARMPRASFWDITQSVMTESNATTGSDVRVFEDLWRDIFTLLPLAEFDNFGVVKAGNRHTNPVEGWVLPQQLLKRVFHFYTTNPRQSPSFNEYCRALAARCHYLVQEWGWRKCSGIIGTWFDFFGSHNLAHLRNEEAHKSPRFLDHLAGNPSLAIDPGDRCFHIFLKTLALVIQRLKKLGLVNDIRNLVARTLPNHNRQYLKEDDVHERDIAALRNHHDLLCTLFWAAPPDLRPAVHLIEKLVVPGSSHREACLTNLRAWGQLAQFVVSCDEGSVAFKPLVSWQNTIFQQLLDQYLSADSDVQQQVLALSKDGHLISKDDIHSTIRDNRRVAMNILVQSVKASFSVLKLAGSLGVATYVLNIYQLQQTFTRFDFSSPDFDWKTVYMAIDMLEHYISMVERVADVPYSSDGSDLNEPHDLEEAVLLLDHKIAEKFFSLGRTMLDSPAATLGEPGELIVQYIEKVVMLCARLACRFIHSSITRTATYFTSRKYGLFRELPLKLGFSQRKYFPLFLATLIKNHVYDFKDVQATLFQMWMLSIVKPRPTLRFENYLAEILKQRNLPYLQGAVVVPGVTPDYHSNFDLFAAGLSYMRKSLRGADIVRSKQRREEYATILQSAMSKMKDDLAALRPEPAEHKKYMNFVRQVIGLVKSHGVGICVVDTFFTQPSADYSPPMEDPQLHTAGIVAYGVRLGEGETTAVPQLLHYLYNNFKIALINDKLAEECGILEKAMDNTHVFSFILTRALPAIIWATSKIYEAWPLLDVYLGALNKLLTRSIVSKEIDEDQLAHVSALLGMVLTWMRTLRCTNQPSLTHIQLHLIVQLMDMAAAFQPSLVGHIYSMSPTDSSELRQSVDAFTVFAEEAGEYLAKIPEEPPNSNSDHIRLASMCRGITDFDTGPVFQSGRELDPQLDRFANIIVTDVRENWVVTSHSISLNAIGRSAGVSSTHSGPGTKYAFLSFGELLEKLQDRLGCWRRGGRTGYRRPRLRKDRMRVLDGDLVS